MKSVNNDSQVAKVRVFFYDINQVNFFKYIPKLLLELIEDNKIEPILFYEEKTEDQEALLFLKKFRCYRVGLTNSIIKYCKKLSPDLVVVNAQRIPDSLIVSFANKNGIPTLMIQHGMYNGNLKRSNELYIRKIFKTIKYFIYGLRIGLICRRNPFSTAFSFIRTFSFGTSYGKLFSNYRLIYAKHIHVYGEYWIDYHTSFFGYSTTSTKFTITGYPDLDQKLSDQRVNFCYVAQSLFEDGRITMEELSKPLTVLQELNKDFSVVVKRHPRSINSIYENFGLRLTDDIPDAEIYIGHYSSLLAVPIVKKRRVALIELEGHLIPDYFKNSSFIVENKNDLIELLSGGHNNKEISKVFKEPIKPSEHKNILLEIVENER